MNSLLYTGNLEQIIAPVTYSSSSATQSGDTLSLKGYDGALIYFLFGAYSGGTATFTIYKRELTTESGTSNVVTPVSANIWYKVGASTNAYASGSAIISGSTLAVTTSNLGAQGILVYDLKADALQTSSTNFDCFAVNCTLSSMTGVYGVWAQAYGAKNSCIPSSLQKLTSD